MKILIIGYGKMGKAIEEIALSKGHEIVGRISRDSKEKLEDFKAEDVDVAIEFTRPEFAYDNIRYCLSNGIRVISGTTGWTSQMGVIETICLQNQGAFLYASNFSLGVNIFFRLNEILAQWMDKYTDYSVSLEETHHLQKLDEPSGTAITLANGVSDNISRLDRWHLTNKDEAGQPIASIPVTSYREKDVTGTHIVSYKNEIDEISIQHKAFNRKGFALGAVVAAEWIADKAGLFSMKDVLGINKV